MEFFIPIKPKPCPRPRVTKRGFAYMPPAYTEWKKEAISHLTANNDNNPLSGHLGAFVVFNVRCPSSWSKKRQDAACSQCCDYPSPDVDNFLKSTLDAMTQAHVWGDDKQVVEVFMRKQYAEKEGIEVFLYPVHISIFSTIYASLKRAVKSALVKQPED